MSEHTHTESHGGGIISRQLTGRDGESYRQFYVRYWIPSENRKAVFKAGREIQSAYVMRSKLQ